MDGPTVSPPRTAAQQAGDSAESLVLVRLLAAGWTVLARNVHVGRHELDLVAVDPGPPAALVVVEVRWRRSRGFGLPEETVDHRVDLFGHLQLAKVPGAHGLAVQDFGEHLVEALHVRSRL